MSRGSSAIAGNTDYGFSPQWEVATAATREGWVAEIKIPVSELKGKIQKVTDYGVFVEIEPGIDGLTVNLYRCDGPDPDRAGRRLSSGLRRVDGLGRAGGHRHGICMAWRPSVKLAAGSGRTLRGRAATGRQCSDGEEQQDGRPTPDQQRPRH